MSDVYDRAKNEWDNESSLMLTYTSRTLNNLILRINKLQTAYHTIVAAQSCLLALAELQEKRYGNDNTP